METLHCYILIQENLATLQIQFHQLLSQHPFSTHYQDGDLTEMGFGFWVVLCEGRR